MRADQSSTAVGQRTGEIAGEQFIAQGAHVAFGAPSPVLDGCFQQSDESGLVERRAFQTTGGLNAVAAESRLGRWRRWDCSTAAGSTRVPSK